MTKGKGRTGAQKRYDKKHPTFSARGTASVKEAIREEYGPGVSVSDALKYFLRDFPKYREMKDQYRKGFEAGKEAGFNEAKEIYQLIFCCPKCKDIVTVESGNRCYDTLMSFLNRFGWWHDSCDPDYWRHYRPPETW